MKRWREWRRRRGHEHTWEFCHFPHSEGYGCIGYLRDYSRCQATKDIVERDCQKCIDGLHRPDPYFSAWYGYHGPPYATVPHWREEAGIVRYANDPSSHT